jgi:hypothetical protein
VHPRARSIVLMVAIAGMAAACASAPVPAPAGTSQAAPPLNAPASPSPDRTTSPVASPSLSIPPAASPSEGPVTLESKVYPYSLTVPALALTRAWIPATQTWDGAAPINMLGGSQVIDRAGLRDGGLFLFGAPAADGLEAFFELHAANGSRFHGCGEPMHRRNVTIGGVPAIAFVQYCLTDQTRAQVTIVKDGFGLASFVDAAHGTELPVLDRLIELLGGLHWRTT